LARCELADDEQIVARLVADPNLTEFGVHFGRDHDAGLTHELRATRRLLLGRREDGPEESCRERDAEVAGQERHRERPRERVERRPTRGHEVKVLREARPREDQREDLPDHGKRDLPETERCERCGGPAAFAVVIAILVAVAVVPVDIVIHVVVHIVVDVVVRLAVTAPRDEPEDARDLQEREHRCDSRCNGKGRIGPGEQKTERGHDLFLPSPQNDPQQKLPQSLPERTISMGRA
jgi:hypothetical protein